MIVVIVTISEIDGEIDVKETNVFHTVQGI